MPDIAKSDNITGVQVKETGSQPNADSGTQRVYIDPSTHHVTRIDSTGTTTDIEAGSGVPHSDTNYTATGTAGNGWFADGAQSVDPAAPAATGWVSFADSGGYWAWRIKNGSDTFKRTFNGVLTAARAYSLPDATGVIVLDTFAQTLTNKTLTSPVLNTGVSGTAVSTDSTFASPSDTILASQKAIKTYVDNTAQGLSWKSEVQATTAAALPANTYANGSSGVGATLTGNSTGALTVDGHTVALNDRILVKNEATQSHNGIYLCTTAGAVGVAYVLTRSIDCDDSAEIPGAAVYTQLGTTNANTAFVCTNTANPVIGTDAITFATLANSGGGITQLTGDVTAGPGGGSQAATLANSGITAGTWTKPTFNAKGLATSGANLAGSDLPVMVASGASHAPGAAPDPGSTAGTAKFLREDASWAVPAGSFTSPLTTKGDILGYDTANNRVPIGADGQVLTADSTQALGLKWAAAAGGGAGWQTLTDGATISWALGSGNATVTIAGNRTLANPTGMTAGNLYSINVVQDSTGARTLTWSSKYLFPNNGRAPVLSLFPGATDQFTFLSDGTNMFLVAVQYNIESTAWSPPTTNMIGWFKADNIASPPASGSLLTTWTDSSPSANDATQSTTVNKPTYIGNYQNGLPTVLFGQGSGATGGSLQSYMATGSNYPGGSGNYSIFTVYAPTLVNTYDFLFGWGAGSTKNAVDVFYYNGQLCNDWWNQSAVSYAGVRLGNLNLSSFHYDGTNQIIRHSMSLLYQAAASGKNTTASAGRIGIQPGNFNFSQGVISEIIIYSTLLSAANIALVEAYLNQKWGLGY